MKNVFQFSILFSSVSECSIVPLFYVYPKIPAVQIKLIAIDTYFRPGLQITYYQEGNIDQKNCRGFS